MIPTSSAEINFIVQPKCGETKIDQASVRSKCMCMDLVLRVGRSIASTSTALHLEVTGSMWRRRGKMAIG